MFKGTLNVKSHYDQWSGLAFIVRGQLGGKCYVVSFQKEAVYILDSDLSNNTSSVMHVNTEFTNVNKPYENNKDYTIEIATTPPTSSPFISTANPSSEMRSWQKSGPPCWLSRAGVTESVVKNVTLYNAMPDGSGSGETNATDKPTATTDSQIGPGNNTTTSTKANAGSNVNRPATGSNVLPLALAAVLAAASGVLLVYQRKSQEH